VGPTSFSSYLNHRFDESTAVLLKSQHNFISTHHSSVPPSESVVVLAMARLKKEKRWKAKSRDPETKKRLRESEGAAEAKS